MQGSRNPFPNRRLNRRLYGCQVTVPKSQVVTVRNVSDRNVFKQTWSERDSSSVARARALPDNGKWSCQVTQTTQMSHGALRATDIKPQQFDKRAQTGLGKSWSLPEVCGLLAILVLICFNYTGTKRTVRQVVVTPTKPWPIVWRHNSHNLPRKHCRDQEGNVRIRVKSMKKWATPRMVMATRTQKQVTDASGKVCLNKQAENPACQCKTKCGRRTNLDAWLCGVLLTCKNLKLKQ